MNKTIYEIKEEKILTENRISKIISEFRSNNEGITLKRVNVTYSNLFP